MTDQRYCDVALVVALERNTPFAGTDFSIVSSCVASEAVLLAVAGVAVVGTESTDKGDSVGVVSWRTRRLALIE